MWLQMAAVPHVAYGIVFSQGDGRDLYSLGVWALDDIIFLETGCCDEASSTKVVPSLSSATARLRRSEAPV